MKRECKFPAEGEKNQKCVLIVSLCCCLSIAKFLALTELLKNLNHSFFLLPLVNKVEEQCLFHPHPQSSHKIKRQLFSETQMTIGIYLCSLVKTKICIFMLFFFFFPFTWNHRHLLMTWDLSQELAVVGENADIYNFIIIPYLFLALFIARAISFSILKTHLILTVFILLI